MTPESASPASTARVRFDATMLRELACPACFGNLRLGAAQLVCTGCGRAYPIIDGIPVLIVERAEIVGR